MPEENTFPPEKYESRELLGGFFVGSGGLTASMEFSILMEKGGLPETPKGMITAGVCALAALSSILIGIKVDHSKWKYLDPPKEQ
ncbi:MAG: hypothetical protein WBO35_02165 [Candidatus Saccharimonadales bacterium]